MTQGEDVTDKVRGYTDFLGSLNKHVIGSSSQERESRLTTFVSELSMLCSCPACHIYVFDGRRLILAATSASTPPQQIIEFPIGNNITSTAAGIENHCASCFATAGGISVAVSRETRSDVIGCMVLEAGSPEQVSKFEAVTRPFLRTMSEFLAKLGGLAATDRIQEVLVGLYAECFKEVLRPTNCLHLIAMTFHRLLPQFKSVELPGPLYVQILFAEQEPKILTIVATTGTEPTNTRLAFDRSVCGLLFEADFPEIILCDPTKAHRERFQDYLGVSTGMPTRSELAMKVSFQNEDFAVINLESPHENVFAPLHVEAARAAAKLLAPLLYALRFRIGQSLFQQFSTMAALDNYLDHLGRQYIHKTTAPLAGLRVRLDSLIRRTDLNSDMRDGLLALQKALSEFHAYHSGFCAEITGFSHFEPRRLRSVLQSAIDLIRPSTLKETNDIDILYEPGEDFFVLTSLFLREIFRNILDNACHWIAARRSTRARGQIRIQVERVPAPPQSKNRDLNQYCRVVIRDNGIGVTEEDLLKVFEPRFSRRGGSGYGLFAAKEFITHLGGFVAAQSEHGKFFEIEIRLRMIVDPEALSESPAFPLVLPECEDGVT